MFKMIKWFVVFSVLVLLAWFSFAAYEKKQNIKNNKLIFYNMKISSPVFDDGGQIPAKYTCLGEGINPPLAWSEVPVNTKTLALIVDDPDAPGGVFSHWVVWDIPVAISEVAENSIPLDAIVGVESSGTNKYFGPCPPSGVHHYRFKLYALDKELFLSVNTRQLDLEREMSGHILAEAQLVGLFEK